MSIKLTDEQCQAIEKDPGLPVRVIDERTNTVYVILRADIFDRVRPLLDEGECNIRDAYPLMDAVARKEGWDDPEMDSYNLSSSREHP
jgi:hypothetical protein